MNLKQLREKRATMLREAEALQGRDGAFARDEDRATFDAKMSEIAGLDEKIREAEAAVAARSRTLLERDPTDPGAGRNRIRGAEGADDDGDHGDDDPDERSLGAEAERQRVQGIMTACRAARLPQKFADSLIESGEDLLDCQRKIFDEMSKRGGDDLGPRRGQARVEITGDDPLVHQRDGIQNALLHRVAPHYFKLEEIGRNYRGLTLLDTAKLYLTSRGQRVTDMSRLELAGVALGFSVRGGYHTTSDFPLLLADVANKTLRRAYDEFPITFAPIVRRTTVPDFKNVNRVQLGDAPTLQKVLEHGEFTRGSISEGREQFAISTYGRIFAITRQALVNDDTSAFERVPMMFGRALRSLESDLVWAQITSNPTMGDSNALFSTAHGNLATDDGAIDTTTLGAARTSMRKQTGLDGQKINVVPRFLIVPAALETDADKQVTTIVPAQASNVNVFSGRLTVVAEPRLDDASTAAWYLAGDPAQIDIIELAMLEGQDGPSVESRIGFDVDGVEIKARHDVAAKVLDWRGLYKNEGDT
jgi:hypothetical protein